MIKVTIGNNVDRRSVIVSSEKTVREVLEENGIDYARGVMHLNGAALKDSDFNKTFEQLGITKDCYLLNVAKAQNA